MTPREDFGVCGKRSASGESIFPITKVLWNTYRLEDNDIRIIDIATRLEKINPVEISLLHVLFSKKRDTCSSTTFNSKGFSSYTLRASPRNPPPRARNPDRPGEFFQIRITLSSIPTLEYC